MYLKIRLLIVMGIWPAALLFAQLLYQNPHLSSEARAKDLMSRLTLKEKA